MGELAAGVCRDGSQWDCLGRLTLMPGTAKRNGSQAMITSGPVLHLSTTTPLTRRPSDQHTHTHSSIYTQHRRTITCWPVLLRRREMLSNSAFQHSTSDYLFSFHWQIWISHLFSLWCISSFLSSTRPHTGNSSSPYSQPPPPHSQCSKPPTNQTETQKVRLFFPPLTSSYCVVWLKHF